jgi:hypothetical protein
MPTPEVHLSAEVTDDAHQLHDVLTGIAGLLRHPHNPKDAEAARTASLRAMAISERLVAHIDAHAAIRLESERAERAHREAQARITAATVTGGAR